MIIEKKGIIFFNNKKKERGKRKKKIWERKRKKGEEIENGKKEFRPFLKIKSFSITGPTLS